MSFYAFDALDLERPESEGLRTIAAELRTVTGEPVIPTEFVGYEGMEALVGWDARIEIAEPGTDPFAALSDDDLLNAHPGILAAMAAAQANQMRILDSAIVPDGHLLERAADGPAKFNEIEVTTPTAPAEVYTVWNENGAPEVVVASSPFFPGLSEREDTGISPLHIELNEDVGDPFAMSMAYACVLMQIGVKVGLPVQNFAEVVSAAWGVPGLFDTGTLAGVAGAQEYSELFRLTEQRTLGGLFPGRMLPRFDPGNSL
jgi:hypothetical protein